MLWWLASARLEFSTVLVNFTASQCYELQKCHRESSDFKLAVKNAVVEPFKICCCSVAQQVIGDYEIIPTVLRFCPEEVYNAWLRRTCRYCEQEVVT